MTEVARIPAGPKIREWSRKHGFSDWMVARWVHMSKQLDLPTGKFLDGLQVRSPQYLRANPLRIDPDELEKRMVARGFELAQTKMDPNLFRVYQAPMSVGATQEHLLGMSTPQDAASASAAIAMQAGSAEAIIDLAAAPGVKTLHMAADMENEGVLVATEPDPKRMRGLRFNLERCGVQNTAMRCHDGQDMPGEEWADKILLDAPCTGEGTLPKDRNRRRGKPEEISTLVALQDELIESADRLLRPGGTFVYATCTFAPEENEGRVQSLLDRGYQLESLPFNEFNGEKLATGVNEWPGLELDDMSKCRRFVPGVHDTLGFFVAKLRKGSS